MIPQIPNDSVHALMALLGQSPAQAGKEGFKRRGKPLCGWSEADRRRPAEYQEWCEKWTRLAFPKLKEGSPSAKTSGTDAVSDQPGQLVLDPFCGSGTIPLACRLMDRHFQAFEINPQFFQIASERINSSRSVLSKEN